jgi:hypothetical protein
VTAPSREQTHSALMRELAENLDRTMAGEGEHVCLAARAGEPKCACYRDVRHEGWHQCLCGARWPVR